MSGKLCRGFSFVVVSYLLLAASSLQAQSEKFGPYLRHAMQVTSRPLPVMVVMTPVAPDAQSVWSRHNPAEVEYHLKKQSLQIQWPLRNLANSWVQSMGVDGKPMIQNYMFLWSSNTMIAKVDQSILWDIAQVPEVTKIIYDRSVKLSYSKAASDQEGEYTYGLQKIGIPRLREEYPNLLGNGVVVGILDTGIDANHPELKGKVVAWKDFVKGKDKPYDGNGHGTHVAGTIAGEGVGGTQIGVAPRVHLVIGKILSDSGSGQLSWIIRGMEWIANPERKLNTNLRPRVVNNSWGGSMPADIRTNPFAQEVANWVALNIFPSFAAGNSGPGTSTIGTPGNLPDAFAVGATDKNDKITSFSSRGPVTYTDKDGKRKTIVKPDICAPGYHVLSSIPGGKYAVYSGTSMATPHLTGAVALIFQANPNLTVDQVRSILKKSADDLGPAGLDNDYGAGRLDVFNAVDLIEAMN